MDSGHIGGHSMRIGIGVEGPSDKRFYDIFLKKEFPQVRFFVQSLGCRTKLIRSSLPLIKQWKDSHFDAGFIIVDRDSDACVQEIFHRFEPSVISESRKPLPERNFSIVVAMREIEAWFLADEDAIHSVFPNISYTVPDETGNISAEGRLKKIWKEVRKSSFNKKYFAEEIAQHFDPNRAKIHSKSFAYFWSRLQSRINKS